MIDFGITELPVSLKKITKQANIRTIKNSLVNKLQGNERGISLLIKNQWVIIYDDKEPIPVSRFTIAHELGHIFLGHSFRKGYHSRNFDKKRPDIENEADMFAARLLAPACVLHELGITSAEEIARVCKISITAAEYRAERMQILEQRNSWYRNPIERQLIKQFEKFIKESRSKNGTL